MKSTPFSGPRPAAGPLSLLLGNGQALLRDGLRRQLEGRAGLNVVAEASSSVEVVASAEALRPDVVLIDDGDGPAATTSLVNTLRGRCPEVAIVVLSSREAVRPALDLVRAGASALLSREDRIEDLERALATVARGENYVSTRLAWSPGGERPRLDAASGPEALSGRERELLQHVADGATLREASRRMEISESTASTYRSRMLKKLDLTNTAQLIRFAVDHGICGPSAAVRRPRDPSPGNGHAPRNGDARPTPAH